MIFHYCLTNLSLENLTKKLLIYISFNKVIEKLLRPNIDSFKNLPMTTKLGEKM